MPKIKINGKEIEAKEGSTILDVAKSEGIDIPTLCHHEALKPYGGCRLCVVEAGDGNSSRVVSSCQYVVHDGLHVQTETPRVHSVRKLVMGLLLIDASDIPAVKEKAEELGVKRNTRFVPDNEPCILCGRCIRACREIVGVSAIDYAGRGYGRKVAAPYFKKSEACIGCGTCFYVCPTGAVVMHEVPEGAKMKVPEGDEITGPARIMENWKAGFNMQICKKCGRTVEPSGVAAHINKTAGKDKPVEDICFMCRE